MQTAMKANCENHRFIRCVLLSVFGMVSPEFRLEVKFQLCPAIDDRLSIYLSIYRIYKNHYSAATLKLNSFLFGKSIRVHPGSK